LILKQEKDLASWKDKRSEDLRIINALEEENRKIEDLKEQLNESNRRITELDQILRHSE